ncbi:MAG TPA: hypothetical protein PK500_01990 [Candidatus Egerieousia sp.]|nr:hypothetical protein [Candidatus Egerieousia sp.]HPT05411.1 hypothetical protein [Candidatus Egerieousia sp.]
MEEKKGLLAELGKVLEEYDSTEDIVKQDVSNCMQSFSKELGKRLVEIEKRLDDIEGKLDKMNNSAHVGEINATGQKTSSAAEEIPMPEEEIPISAEEEINEVPTDSELIAEEEAEEEEKTVATKEEKSKPDWYDWEVDYPADYVDDLIGSMGLNDRMQFINELFNGKEIEFENVIEEIDNIGNFKRIVGHLREEYPQWDETSDIVYRFYMHIRRKYDINKAETEE